MSQNPFESSITASHEIPRAPVPMPLPTEETFFGASQEVEPVETVEGALGETALQPEQ